MRLLAPAHEKRSGVFARILQFTGLSVTVFALFFAAIAVHFAAMYIAPTPHQLYHLTWEAVPHLAFDRDKLENWKSFEHKFDDKIKTHEDAVKYANEMIKELDDPHTRLHSPVEVAGMQEQSRGNFAGVGIEFRFKLNPDKSPVLTPDGVPTPDTSDDGYPVVHRVIDDGPAESAGIVDGEVLVSADGTSFKDASMETVITSLKGKEGTTVSVVVRDAQGVERTIDITRGIVDMPTVEVKKFGSVGYISLSGFIQDDTIDELRQAFKETEDSEALIFDLRNNGGGRLDFAFTIASMFLPEGDIVRIKSRLPAMGYEEIITRLTPSTMQGVRVDDNGQETLLGEGRRQPDLSKSRPVVLLVNGGSASASEVVTGALVDNHRVVVVGTKTFGKGIGQSMLPFAGRTMLRITTFQFYSPDGNWAGDAHNNRVGFVPDHVVEPGEDFEMVTDTDNQLNFAIKLLEETLSKGN